MSEAPARAGDRILSVVELTGLIKGTLEGRFPAVWVRGQISGLRIQSSGHFYFSLKDGDAILGCAMFRLEAGRIRFEPKDGLEVEAFGRIEVYAVQGKYQLVVREMRLAGVGALQLAFEELKRKLQAEGLFDAARKRPLPSWPRRIGLVTSPTGAAVRDMVKVARARWPSIELVLAPVRVQGVGAAAEIANAIRRFNRYGDVDLLIVGRGGGSTEELWAFNEEAVVRAIAASEIPVVSAVGHEVDVTLADLAADVRAATPSNAAEIAVPSRAEALRRVEGLAARLTSAARQRLLVQRHALGRLMEKYGFRRQKDLLDQFRQNVDRALARALERVEARLAAVRERLNVLRESYGLREFGRSLRERRDRVQVGARDMKGRLDRQVKDRRREVLSLEHRLRALSPKLVLARGYCLARAADGRLLRDAAEARVGDLVTVEFARGEADARVETVRTGGDDGQSQ